MQFLFLICISDCCFFVSLFSQFRSCYLFVLQMMTLDWMYRLLNLILKRALLWRLLHRNVVHASVNVTIRVKTRLNKIEYIAINTFEHKCNIFGKLYQSKSHETIPEINLLLVLLLLWNWLIFHWLDSSAFTLYSHLTKFNSCLPFFYLTKIVSSLVNACKRNTSKNLQQLTKIGNSNKRSDFCCCCCFF